MDSFEVNSLNKADTFYYRYFDFVGVKATLSEQRVRFRSPRLFNDPFDIQFMLRPPVCASEMVDVIIENQLEAISQGKISGPWSGELSDIELKEKLDNLRGTPLDRLRIVVGSIKPYLEGRCEAIISHQNELIWSQIADRFVLCLSTEPKNILMWSHYTNGHTGAVIKFRGVKSKRNAFCTAEPVQYFHRLPTMGSKEQWLSSLFSDTQAIDYEAVYKSMRAAKAKEWEYEKEYRIVVSIPERKGHDHFFLKIEPYEISEIIFGCQMPESNRRELALMAKSKFPDAKISQARKSSKEFQLEFIDLA